MRHAFQNFRDTRNPQPNNGKLGLPNYHDKQNRNRGPAVLAKSMAKVVQIFRYFLRSDLHRVWDWYSYLKWATFPSDAPFADGRKLISWVIVVGVAWKPEGKPGKIPLPHWMEGCVCHYCRETKKIC